MLTLCEPQCPLPLDTPEAVVKTAAALGAEAAPEPLWVAQTRATAAVMNVMDQVDAVLPASKLASTDPRLFALTRDGVSHLPLRTAADIASTIEFVLRHDGRTQAGYVDGAARTKIARAVLSRAAALGVNIPLDTQHELYMQAGEGTCDVAELRDAVLKRAVLLGGEDGAKLRKQAAAITAVPPNAELQRLAETLEACDVDNGFTDLYATSGLQPPARQLFQQTPVAQKRAAVRVVETRGRQQYAIDALTGIPDAVFRDWLGDAAVDAMRDPVTGRIASYKLAEVIPTLSEESTEQLTTALRLAGVSPLPR